MTFEESEKFSIKYGFVKTTKINGKIEYYYNTFIEKYDNILFD